jgi:hypothetical protein
LERHEDPLPALARETEVIRIAGWLRVAGGVLEGFAGIGHFGRTDSAC